MRMVVVQRDDLARLNEHVAREPGPSWSARGVILAPAAPARGIAVFSRDSRLADEVAAISAIDGYRCVVAGNGTKLDLAQVGAFVIDAEHRDAATALACATQQIASTSSPCWQGPRAVVARSVLLPTLRAVARATRHRAFDLERLLGVAIGAGPLEHALAVAAEEIAAAFGAERCVFSVHDSSASYMIGTESWSSRAWSETADRCRVAASVDATLVGARPDQPDECESVIAAPLEASVDGCGFLAVIARSPRIFSNQERRALGSLALRFSVDLERARALARSLEQVDRYASTPGIDAKLNLWNRAGLIHLAATYASAARRCAQPLTAMVIDISQTRTIHSKQDVAVGDQLLRRVSDALRAVLHAEDVIGRWEGDTLGLLLPGIRPDAAQRLAKRIQTAFDEGDVRLPNGEPLAIRARLGISAFTPAEDPTGFVERAAAAARTASECCAVVATSAPAKRTAGLTHDAGNELHGLLGGSYRLLHEISRGGMGVVYRAEDLALERPVAIKMLRPDLAADQAFIETLRREAALLARVEHPSLVKVYSFGQVGEDSYFVMELVEGESLRAALDRYRLERTLVPISEALVLVQEIASALDTLHEIGIIHRDVKPDNVIRDPFRGRSVLVDVGIARRFGQSGGSSGTPGYVAPEVIRGEETTARSDVYGLAATTYALLTLREPWGVGKRTEVLTRQVQGQGLVPVARDRPELAAVDPVLAKALSLDPMQRPSSARQFARELRDALPATIIPPRPRRSTNTALVPRSASAARTRGVVFRSLPRALGAREAGRLRDSLAESQPELAHVIGDAAPLAWLPTDLLLELFELAPGHLGRDAKALARDMARASVRATLRRFFPASAATLAPERMLSVMRTIWTRYQSWGDVTSMPVQPGHHAVKIASTPRVPELCAWAQGLIEQLVVLAGGTAVDVTHPQCEVHGAAACLFEVRWQ